MIITRGPTRVLAYVLQAASRSLSTSLRLSRDGELSHPRPPSTVDFSELVPRLHGECTANRSGNKATYIPQLEKVNAELFGVSLCTVDGKFHNAGDFDLEFCLQSTVKTMTYALARELTSKEYVHKHVGFEPSGVKFNAHVLNEQGLPHNPLINAGAIMVCSLLKPQEEMSVRYELVKQFIDRLAGHVVPLGFDNSVYLSEAAHADRNRSLAYFMRENNAFPANTHIEDTLGLYFQSCSINGTCQLLAAAAATLANQGVCPMNGEQVVSAATARDTLSLMYMCGMYDWSGQFAFEIGLPAKSGVSGALMVSIPNVGGLCIWSPRLDTHGNSVRGVEFMQRFIKEVDCHIFQTVVSQKPTQTHPDPVLALITATSTGDLEAVKKILVTQHPNVHDYDKRAPLHLACAEGHVGIVRLLLAAKADPNFKDRWGNTAFSEAANAINAGLAGPELLDMLTAASPSPSSAADTPAGPGYVSADRRKYLVDVEVDA